MFYMNWNAGKAAFWLGSNGLMTNFSNIGGLPEQCGTEFLPHCT